MPTVSRRARPAGAAGSAGPLAAARLRGRRRGSAAARSYFEALSTIAQPRLGAAHRRADEPRQVHRPADPRAVRPRARSRRKPTTWPAAKPSCQRTLDSRLRAFGPAGVDRAADRGRRVARPAAGARLRHRARRRRRRPTPRRTTRSGWSESIRRSATPSSCTSNGDRPRRSRSTARSSPSGRRWRSPTSNWRCCSGRWDSPATPSPRSGRRCARAPRASSSGPSSATYLAESGNVKEAIPLLEQTVSQGEPDVDALNALGIALARAGNVSQAGGVVPPNPPAQSRQHDGAREPRVDRARREPHGRGARVLLARRSRPIRCPPRPTTGWESSS